MDDHEDRAPKPIRRLQENLINRIAAGEVIHRPASALKELIENSLDAGSTSIRITVKDGGLKLLQLQDNGCGIRKADLPILAERFTTSKLQQFSDLSKISTYGFRGEALASMSYVSHLSVVTKTQTDPCAWKAFYAYGKLMEGAPGQTVDPKACAGNDGTIITIEDLFYNTPTRLSALRSTSEEYNRILDVVTKYAVHNPTVAFTCKKVGSTSPELTTPSTNTPVNTIRMLYGHTLAREMLSSSVTCDASVPQSESWKAEIHFSSANYQGKKTIFLLFINHRLVESSRLKRALENVYTGILPKGTSPFIYLNLQIDPRAVDVNVHPTKKEVHFLNEEGIIEKVADSLTDALAAKGESRVFQTQTLLTAGGDSGRFISKKRKSRDEDMSEGEDGEEGEELAAASTQTDPKKKVSSHLKVRTSTQDRTLDSMFPVTHSSQIGSSSSDLGAPPKVDGPRDVHESQCLLHSVLSLRALVCTEKHELLTEIIEKHTFVGIVDLNRCLSLIQHSTNLYLVNHASLAEELFYQLGLRQFGNMSKLKLDPPPPLRTLVKIAVEAEDIPADAPLPKPQIVDRIVDILMARREMLSEYFSFNISEDGLLQSLPLILRDYTPNLDKIPEFLMRLGPQVNWTSESECFQTFLRELAYFYVPGPAPCAPYEAEDNQQQEKAERWQIQHVVFPAMRRYLTAPKALLDADVVQVASLPELYKVFERC
ncbi:DNA mismatch repair protein MutL [Cylindrobasidium torrendii FP15055 ss-10]|uniref:DNA mismatch repair protein MutL n=1 Tax=Cylindrobasidium torrendii FP15055 ss-10 TaxID=1314674 RepID=A0A0D7AY42_9AGAR|nr:DNA mismatch repair protein MutL [Cylindrobasidium torrendii FP15055 ss-10]